MLGIPETGRLDAGLDLNELISTTIMDRYTEDEREMPIKLSILDSFTLPQAAYVTENQAAATMIKKLSRDSSFIRFDERSQKYYAQHFGWLFTRAARK